MLVDNKQSTLFNVIVSAIVLALANMGDAFLYAWLPTNFHDAGITPFWVGAILSANRFSRLFLNSRVAWLLSNRDIKSVTFFVAIIASFTTITYGWLTAIPLWILARIL